MGANAQTSVPTFTAGDVLTAANMNISARTGVPVFADTTARDAAFGGTGEKTLAEGQLCYVENLTGDAQIQYYDGSAWNSLGAAGLTLISSTTIGSAVSSVTVSSAFSSTYDNYRVIVSGGVGSANLYLTLTLGATTTGYYTGLVYRQYSNTTVNGSVSANGSSFIEVGRGTTNSLSSVFDLLAPNLAKNTHLLSANSGASTTDYWTAGGGYLADTTQYTAFTLTTSTGTMTGGTVKVYGYKN